MEPFERSRPSTRPLFERSGEPAGSSSAASSHSSRPVRTPFTHRICEALTEALIYFMVVFAPWAFGTTQSWSIWTMNMAGYFLGALLVAKWLIRWLTGFTPSRWGVASRSEELIVVPERGAWIGRTFVVLLAVLTGAILIYCVISALNARAIYLPVQRRFDYRDYVKWLPHSYDPASTWEAFWSYLGLACFFWAARDWLLGKTTRERRTSRSDHEEPADASVATTTGSRLSHLSGSYIPVRLRRLLWVMSVNGALLALEAILQRLSGTNKLLWLVVPWINSSAEHQFGPYAYRSNAATYFNLLWPVCVGFWLLLRRLSIRAHRGGRVGQGSHAVLLPCAVLMAAAPIISTARGGALIALGNILAISAVILVATREEKSWIRAGMLSVFLIVLLFAGYLGWTQLAARFENLFVDQMSNRTEIYDNAALIARDFPVFGTGPGTFGTIYRLYKERGQEWAAYVHDDWLETRISFGWVGVGLIVAMLLLTFLRWLAPAGLPARWELVAVIWLAVGGALLHAKFDFPLQIYSIQLLFVLLCSMLSSVSRPT